MVKFTDGPWVALETGDIETSTGERFMAPGTSAAEIHVNAQLISAAPDLLDALRGVRFVINSNPTLHHLRNEPWWVKVQKAISKSLPE